MNAPSHTKPLLPVVWAIGEGRRRAYSPTNRLVLIVLANHMNGERECWPSLAALALECGCSVRQVQFALRRFEAAGLIVTEPGTGRGFTSRYRLLAETINSAAQPDLFPDAPSQKPETLYIPPKPKRQKRGQGVPISDPGRVNQVHPLESKKGESLRRKRVNQIHRESTKENPPSTALRAETAVAVSSAAPPEFDPRKALWTEGRETLRKLTGQMNGEAGRQIGRFLKLAGGDAVSVLRALEAAAVEGPYEPIPWIVAAIHARGQERHGKTERIRRRAGLGTMLTPAGEDAQ